MFGLVTQGDLEKLRKELEGKIKNNFNVPYLKPEQIATVLENAHPEFLAKLIVQQIDPDSLQQYIADAIKDKILPTVNVQDVAKAIADKLIEDDYLDTDELTDRVAEVLAERMEIKIEIPQ